MLQAARPSTSQSQYNIIVGEHLCLTKSYNRSLNQKLCFRCSKFLIKSFKIRYSLLIINFLLLIKLMPHKKSVRLIIFLKYSLMQKTKTSRMSMDKTKNHFANCYQKQRTLSLTSMMMNKKTPRISNYTLKSNKKDHTHLSLSGYKLRIRHLLQHKMRNPLHSEMSQQCYRIKTTII